MTEKIDRDVIRKLDRGVRRNAQKKNGNQDRFRTRTERDKTAYNRKDKHRLEEFHIEENYDEI